MTQSKEQQSVPFQGLLKELERYQNFRMFRALQFGNSDVTLSIQAGGTHYCSPRETLPLGDTSYTAWEIGFQRKEIEGTQLDEEINWESPNEDWTVAGYVPTAQVQELVDLLTSRHGAPTLQNLHGSTRGGDSQVQAPEVSEAQEPEEEFDASVARFKLLDLD